MEIVRECAAENLSLFTPNVKKSSMHAEDLRVQEQGILVSIAHSFVIIKVGIDKKIVTSKQHMTTET